MCPSVPAILRNCRDEHLYTLKSDEAELFEVRARIGEVDRFVVRRKGKDTVVFRLREPRVAASSNPSRSSLTKSDAESLAGLNGTLSGRQIERLTGHLYF